NINDNALLPSEIDSSDTYMIGAVQEQNELVELIDVDKVISDVLNPKSENDSAQDIHSEQEELYSAGIC
ncbi:hypothetical protein, partial [Succinivibrio dextrinosolvens]|uniref:hypothetical protein n=1 Tax=Succinivibrio dextrinosolvens TaxID=83771 RepID=UPI0024790ECB